jgi:uncharacterized protein
MTKLLLWVVLIVVALLVLRLVNIASAKRRNDAGRGASAKDRRADKMVRCVRCGVYLPSADAKSGPDGLICGEPSCVEQR